MEERRGIEELDPDERRRLIAERRRARREQDRRRRRMFMRRRLTALASAAAVLALVLVLLGGHGGDSGLGSGPPSAAEASSSPPAQTGAKTQKIRTKQPRLVSGFDEPVPILMYHVIAAAPADAANPGLFVPPDELEAQVRWLARKGFTAVTLSHVFAAWQDGAEIPSKPIVISFDDGTADQHDTAGPILAAAGWPGELNLKVESLQQHEMTDEMIEDLLAGGWELASHTRTHPDLTTLDPDSLKTEVLGSRKALERRFGVPVDFFCYPSGRYDEEVIAAVEDAGYTGATTTEPGLAQPDRPYELARIRIEPGDGADGLATKLANAGL